MTHATLAKLALTLLVVVAGGGFMIYSSVGHAQHYKMVHELVATDLDGWNDTELKVHGKVASGTVVAAVVDQEMQRTFVLEMNGKRIRVFARGPVPDTFKDQAEVVATGRLIPAADRQALADALCAKASRCPLRAGDEQRFVVEATEVMAKCPGHYKEGGADAKMDMQYH
jgi:cytochrome c-type biogenesis protein CcmE